MVDINFATREVSCKIVYYGPGRSGKTTNLEWIHAHAPTGGVGELVSVATETDRTIFFDFLPLDLGEVAGMRTKFQLYTVPGQVYYDATRKIVLEGVDGVIFVADSHPDMAAENLESLENLAVNLKGNGLDIQATPLVLQWNKRDLPDAVPVEQLEKELNPRGLPSTESVAIKGEGVFTTLKKVASLVIQNLNKEGVGSETRDEDLAPVATAPQSPLPAAPAAPLASPPPEGGPLPPPPLLPEQAGLPASMAAAFTSPAEPPAGEKVTPEPDSAEPPPPPAPAAAQAEPPALGAAPRKAHEQPSASPAFPSAAPKSRAAEAVPARAKPSDRALPPEPSRARGAPRTSAPSRASPFKWRLATGGLGAAAVLVLQGAYFWGEIAAAWEEATGGMESGLWLRYLMMGGMLLGLVVLCALIAAVQDRSVLRVFQLGVAWCAGLVLGLSAYRALYPGPSPGSPGAYPVPVQMLETALNPARAGRWLALNEERAVILRLREELKGQETASARASTDSQRELAEAGAAAAKLTRQIEALKTQAEQARDLVKAGRRGARRKIDELQEALAEKEQLLQKLRQELEQARPSREESPEPGASDDVPKGPSPESAPPDAP